MNFFKSGIQSVLGTAETSENTTGAETVSDIIDFLTNCKISNEITKFLKG